MKFKVQTSRQIYFEVLPLYAINLLLLFFQLLLKLDAINLHTFYLVFSLSLLNNNSGMIRNISFYLIQKQIKVAYLSKNVTLESNVFLEILQLIQYKLILSLPEINLSYHKSIYDCDQSWSLFFIVKIYSKSQDLIHNNFIQI